MPDAERRDHGLDLVVREHAVEPRLLDVDELAADGQDRLVRAVAALLGGAACRVALDDEDLGARGVALLAVGELARQAGAVERALAAGELARLAGGLARAHGLACTSARSIFAATGFSSRYADSVS